MRSRSPDRIPAQPRDLLLFLRRHDSHDRSDVTDAERAKAAADGCGYVVVVFADASREFTSSMPNAPRGTGRFSKHCAASSAMRIISARCSAIAERRSTAQHTCIRCCRCQLFSLTTPSQIDFTPEH